jgi:hypothetical protein
MGTVEAPQAVRGASAHLRDPVPAEPGSRVLPMNSPEPGFDFLHVFTSFSIP